MLTIHDLKEIMNTYTEALIRLAYFYVKDPQAAEDIALSHADLTQLMENEGYLKLIEKTE